MLTNWLAPGDIPRHWLLLVNRYCWYIHTIGMVPGMLLAWIHWDSPQKFSWVVWELVGAGASFHWAFCRNHAELQREPA